MGGERDALLSKAQLDAEAARRQLLARAEAEATAALTAARADIAHERVEAMRELRERAASLGVALARRLLEAAEADGVTPHLLDEALAALPTLNDGDHIEIVSARPLTPGERDHCLERLHGADVRFAVDPLLIAGVELHFGSSILHHSWRDALADAERALAGDGDAR
jgi:F-type H+-transporting ATPase subunit b